MSSQSFLALYISGEAALAASAEAIEMPYVLKSSFELVHDDPANVSDTAKLLPVTTAFVDTSAIDTAIIVAAYA